MNKRGYKHRVIFKLLKNELEGEYTVQFKSFYPVSLREIQIGFINYWQTDNEVYAQPLSVVVEAGMSPSEPTIVC